MNDKVNAIISLEVDDVKVYEAKACKVSLLTKGKLEIIYIPECDRFVLRLNSFKYPLSIHVPILASLHEEEAFRSYVLPNIGGHYVLKLKTAPTQTVLRNLDTILASYGQFSYKTDEEYDLENQHHRGPVYPVMSNEPKEEVSKEEESNEENVLHHVPTAKERLVKMSRYFKSGSEFVKQKAMKAANYVGKTLSHPKEQQPPSQASNQLYVKTIDELKSSENNDSPVIELAKYEMSGLMTLSHEIERYALIQAEKDKGFKLNPPSGPKAWPVFKKHAVDSAKSLWHGMDDALSNLSKTVKTKKNSKKSKEDPHQMEQGEHRAHTSEPMQQIDVNRKTQNAGPTKHAHTSSWDMKQGNQNYYGGNPAVMGQISDSRYSRKA